MLILLLLELGFRLAGGILENRLWRDLARRATAQSAGRITILALGESTTFGLWVDPSQSYPAQLERALRAHYGTDRIDVLIPPHIGQNTSQMANRITRYVSTFQPSAVIIMAGVNNSWSLEESHIARFLPGIQLGVRSRMLLDRSRVFKFVRLLAHATRDRAPRLEDALAGAPSFATWPPEHDLLVDVGPNAEPFLALWRYDVTLMIDAARRAGSGVLLMTYPNWASPPPSEVAALAAREGVAIVDNYASFRSVVAGQSPDQFLFPDGHPREPGYAMVAHNAFQAMTSSHMLDRRIAALKEK